MFDVDVDDVNAGGDANVDVGESGGEEGDPGKEENIAEADLSDDANADDEEEAEVEAAENE